MAKSNLVTLGVVLGTICLLLIGGAYFAFSEASDSFDESMDNSEAGCESFFGWCWFLPGGSFGCGFCLLGIFLVGLVVPIMFGGFLSGLVGIWYLFDSGMVHPYQKIGFQAGQNLYEIIGFLTLYAISLWKCRF